MARIRLDCKNDSPHRVSPLSFTLSRASTHLFPGHCCLKVVLRRTTCLIWKGKLNRRLTNGRSFSAVDCSVFTHGGGWTSTIHRGFEFYYTADCEIKEEFDGVYRL